MSASEDLSEVECPPRHDRHHRSEREHRGAALPPPKTRRHRHPRRTDPEVPTESTPDDRNGHRSSGHYWKGAKTGRLRQAEHQVHVLDRLPGSALDEVVLRRKHEREIGSLRAVDGNAYRVRSPYAAGIWRRPGSHHVDEWFAGVAFLVERLQIDVRSLERR